MRIDQVKQSVGQVVATPIGREAHDWLGALAPPLGGQSMQALDEAEIAAAWFQHPSIDVPHLQ